MPFTPEQETLILETLETLSNIDDRINSTVARQVSTLKRNLTAELKPVEPDPMDDAGDDDPTADIKDPKARAIITKLLAERRADRNKSAEGSKREALASSLEAAGVTGKTGLKYLYGEIGSKITDVDGEFLVGDRTLDEFAAEWAQTDEGKLFRAAPDGSGGGAVPKGRPALRSTKNPKVPEGKRQMSEVLVEMLGLTD